MDTPTLVGIIGLVVAIIGLLVTVIEKWGVIAPKIKTAYYEVSGKVSFNNFNPSRRHYLIISALAIVAGTVSYSLRFLDLRIFNENDRWSKYSQESSFVVNKKNGTIHLKGICDDHLPISQTTIIDPVASHLHGSKQQQITKEVLIGLPDYLREELLIEAIIKSPTSTHLYKYLISQWGRRKEYSKIHEFLLVNIKFLESKLASISVDKKKKRYSKAIYELRARKDNAEYLASISKFT